MLGLIDGMAAEIGEAADRNWNRWHQGSEDYQVSVGHLRDWIENRLTWIDEQFIEAPVFSPGGGLVDVGAEVTISVHEGDIYYTVDGTDPRGIDGNPVPEALAYAAPIRITEYTEIKARARIDAALWTRLTSASYYTYLLPLVVTEVMYNPPADPAGEHASINLEFLELQNISDAETIDLTGVAFVGRVSFTFANGTVTSLAPKEYVVVCRNLQSFGAIYGEGITVAGEYDGALGNTRMEIDFDGPVGEELMLFTYEDDWYPSTDGQGHSLVIRDPTAPRASWNDPGSWRPSFRAWGSPGQDDVETAGLQLPGDFSQDGRLTISDPVGLLRYIVLPGGPGPCMTAAGDRTLMDANGDDLVNLADAIHLLQYLFLGGPPPAAGRDCIPVADCPSVCAGAPR